MEFKLPERLEGYTEQKIHDKMLENAPEGVDLSEGHMFWDHTRPTAIVLAEYTEFHLPLALMMRFPQFATGIYLDYHGEMIGVERRKASKSFGDVLVKSDEDITLRRGATFIVYGDDKVQSLEYESLHSVALVAGEVIPVPVVSKEAGREYNIPAGSVNAIEEKYEGVIIVGSSEMKGGLDDEDDDTYKSRIISYYRSRPLSGAKRDYERWALEVPGVGSAIVQPLWAGNGTVRVLITDENNNIASAELIEKVQSYIDPQPRGEGGGKAPIGARVTIDTMKSKAIDVTFKELTIRPNFKIHEVKESITKNLNSYFSETHNVNYNKCVALVMTTEGVNDFGDMLLDGERNNIELKEDERARVGVIKIES